VNRGASPLTTGSVITFRSLETVDLSLAHRWLNEPCVLKWYAKRTSTYREVAAKYMPRIEGRDPVHVFVVAIDDDPVGLIQRTRLSAFPDYSALVGAESDWAGIDFFIGEPKHRGLGLGARILDQFVREEVLGAQKADTCVSGPSPENVKSIGALLRAGFTHLRSIEISAGEIEYVMVRCRDRVA
jgi:aminoglycoside 6'-N-acetyltransferase